MIGYAVACRRPTAWLRAGGAAPLGPWAHTLNRRLPDDRNCWGSRPCVHPVRTTLARSALIAGGALVATTPMRRRTHCSQNGVVSADNEGCCYGFLQTNQIAAPPERC